MAFNGSPAATSGDVSRSRLNDKAQAALNGITDLTKEDVAFIKRVYFNTEKNMLLIRAADSTSDDGVPLSKEEKKRFVKLMILILLALYSQTVKNLTQQEQLRVQRKLMTKYAAKGGTPDSLIKMVNKYADRI